MPTCRCCLQRYECDFSRRVKWCFACEGKGRSVILAQMQAELDVLSEETGAYMALVWENEALKERWHKVVDTYWDIKHTFAPSLKQAKFRAFEIRIQATIKQGGLFSQLCGAWWKQMNRQYDYDELEWELIKWEAPNAD